MRVRRFLPIVPLLLATLFLSSCVTLPGSGSRIDSDAVYRAQDDAFRPMAR